MKNDQYPIHWGHPPDVQTANITELPGGYGHGSSTMAGWIRRKMEEDKVRKECPMCASKRWIKTGGYPANYCHICGFRYQEYKGKMWGLIKNGLIDA